MVGMVLLLALHQEPQLMGVTSFRCPEIKSACQQCHDKPPKPFDDPEGTVGLVQDLNLTLKLHSADIRKWQKAENRHRLVN